ncbi:YsnF/AvaK domain-containing protein [Lichenicoccus roseus]|uniref:DUF2382 domain-containing protein n=1 Tax=Lichenicoccus roseus TaxID=2683649 RepID=A0A5R9IYM4_9PROT|nr:YsnF/AvaK domain-containing protein [Lichenicoccus roseus]TLU70575.1 DUF2382 domain-containing protein [Lichenicoccus roseus]
MASEKIVAVYDTFAHAEMAAQDLLAAGVPPEAISRHSNTGSSPGTTKSPNAPTREKGFWAQVLGGEPDQDATVYERSVSGGSTVVTVDAPDEHISAVTAILESHHPIDLDERASSYALADKTSASLPDVAASRVASVPAADIIPLAEEQLVVGKRLVNRGSTRVRRFVVETPVEEQVTLRDEVVTIERRPVTDASQPADSFSDKVIEMAESGEEAVAGKTAHVYEEVSLHKEVIDRVETVKDTVRREDVQIDQVPSEAAGTGMTSPSKSTASNLH